MIIFKNSFVTLDFNPTTDTLSVDMPTVNHLVMPEVRQTLRILVEHVRNYHVKRLLIDARKTEVEVSEEAYASLLSDFMRELMQTRVQRVARIVSSSTVRENVAGKVGSDKKLSLDFRSFTEVNAAIEWLTQ